MRYKIQETIVVEVSIMSALLLKMAQLERYLEIRCLAAKEKEDVNHCVTVSSS